MARFAFYFGFDSKVVSRMQHACETLWGKVQAHHSEGFHLFVAMDHGLKGFCETSKAVGYISGYVRCDGLVNTPTELHSVDWLHNSRFLEEVVNNEVWPLGDNWTGSFAAVGFDKDRRRLVVCNDLIGYRPVYIRQLPEGVIGSSSLILISHCSDCQPDVIGILQRITPPYYCNYGRRTLLSEVWRPLPGEWVCFDSPNATPESRFDNSLCKGVLDGDPKEIARKVWDCLQREVALAISSNGPVAVALSGGWDSRLVLAAVANISNQIQCYTYGRDDLYEVQIAKRCADAVGASHSAFSIEEKYFPPRQRFEQLVKDTEAAKFMVWNTILEQVNAPQGIVLLLGDMTESIQGRDIVSLSYRKSKISSFLRWLFDKEHELSMESTREQFIVWSSDLKRDLINSICNMKSRLSSRLSSQVTTDEIKQVTENDIDLSLLRVLLNWPSFTCMFNEIFQWFHEARLLMTCQDLLLESRFFTINPCMSMRFLRLISTVHPRIRVSFRLLDAIARLPELEKLARIPSAQVPWVSGLAPLFMRKLIWGFRSKVDQILIRRMLKAKNPNLRQRVLKSLDYVAEYRRPETIENVKSWFSGRWIKPDYYVELCRKRAALEAWPLINLDIAAPANVSVILDLCKLQ